jgi:hypothetical protein
LNNNCEAYLNINDDKLPVGVDVTEMTERLRGMSGIGALVNVSIVAVVLLVAFPPCKDMTKLVPFSLPSTNRHSPFFLLM